MEDCGAKLLITSHAFDDVMGDILAECPELEVLLAGDESAQSFDAALAESISGLAQICSTVLAQQAGRKASGLPRHKIPIRRP